MNKKMRRIFALVLKESYQIIRDPSSILIAFILPLMLLFLFAYGISMDIKSLNIGVINESRSPEANDLVTAFKNSGYFHVTLAADRRDLKEQVGGGNLLAVVVIPYDFPARIKRGDGGYVQSLVCGTDSNTAELALGYIEGAIRNWLWQRGDRGERKSPVLLNIETRIWFNEEIESRSALLPGSIAVIMTLIGTMLTSLVIAREWERGTMEALLSTPATSIEILMGKFIPYFVLGMIAMGLVTAVTTLLLGVPFRGSLLVLTIVSAAYLCAALGLGLLISTLNNSQFAATQVALIVGYLPSFLLSGIVFEICSMPLPIRIITYCMPPRYFVSSLQTLFLAGNVWEVIVPDTVRIFLFAVLFLAATAAKTKKTLES